MTTEQTTEAGPAALAGSVSWFEVGTSNPEAAQAFYGEIFGWSYALDETSKGRYHIVTTGADHPIRGGIADTSDQGSGGYAVFCVVVEDVAVTCRRVEALGGKVILGPVPTPSGLVLAHLRDPDGNHFGIYSPPAGEQN